MREGFTATPIPVPRVRTYTVRFRVGTVFVGQPKSNPRQSARSTLVWSNRVHFGTLQYFFSFDPDGVLSCLSRVYLSVQSSRTHISHMYGLRMYDVKYTQTHIAHFTDRSVSRNIR